MSDAHTARKLRRHVEQMQTMTRFVLATLSLASGVYTYLGVRSLLDGSATLVFFAAIIYAAAVSVGIYGFWTYLIRFLPEIRDGASRMALVAVMAVGSAMIIAMSSWLNAAALAGSAAVEQHFEKESAGFLPSIYQSGLTSKFLQALVSYNHIIPMWEKPVLVKIFQRYNISRQDWELIEKIFREADAAYRLKGLSIHEAYEGWRAQMPGDRS